MCFSFESSINSWFYAVISIIILLFLSQSKLSIWISMFTLTFTQIQLIEAMIWKNINDELNNKLVKYISVLLWFQPLIQSLFSYLYSKNSFMLYLFFIYLIIILKELKSTDIFTLTISDKGHLVWNRYENNKKIHILSNNNLYLLLYLTGMILPLTVIESNIARYLLIGYGTGSLIYSILNYTKDEMGSLWCYHAVNYILIGVLLQLTGELY